jgi:decaprenyl-phosphate phosphoribosyltransferase
MRPNHWVKNSFLFAPLIFTGEFQNFTSIRNVFVASILFCIASSTVYIINDIHDIEKDREHPKKKKSRPLAAGIISIKAAYLLNVFLYLLLICAFFFNPQVIKIIAIYICLNFFYTFILKNQPVIDIFTIAIGFVLRVYAGASALFVSVSGWMFVTTLCLALYLASIKRRQELNQHGMQSRVVLEKYSISLIDRYAEMSATGALIFYSIFVMSSRSELIITIPIVLFGLFRYWYIVDKLNAGESPSDALLEDKWLIITILLWIFCCGWALK